MKYTAHIQVTCTLLFCLVASLISAQQVLHASELTANAAFENIHVEAIHHTDDASLFTIWVKQGVKAHRHNAHTEHVYILEGTGTMLLGEEVLEIKPGDVIIIPRGTIHAVRTTSEEPLKVLSIQSPRFSGKDREFVDVGEW